MNSNSLINKEKQEQTNKRNDMKIEFQNSIVKFRFLCRVTDIKIAWINTCGRVILLQVFWEAAV